MTYQDMICECTAKRRGDPSLALLNNQLTISDQLIDCGIVQPESSTAYTIIEERRNDTGEIECSWLPFVRKQLQAIRSLRAGWDSYCAPSPDARLVTSAEGLIECLAQDPSVPQPHVNPTPVGSVQFEWESGDRYFELEVVAERAANYLFCDAQTHEEETGSVFEQESLGPVLDLIKRVEDHR